MEHKKTEKYNEILPVSCNKDCGAGCPLTAAVRGGTVEKITTNPLAPRHMRGCARGFAAHKAAYAPDRLTSPLIQTGTKGSNNFREISWQEALDRTADTLQETKERYGNGSIMSFGGSGACRGALHNTRFLTERFLTLFGGFIKLQGNYSAGALNFVQPYLFGDDPPGIDPATLDEAQMIILWGANVTVTRFGANLESIVTEHKKKGVPIVVIDPRKTGTVRKLSTWWVPILPGTDAILMCALLWIFINQGFLERDFITQYSHGFDELENYIVGREDGIPKDPEWAASRCGVPKDVIYALAEMYATRKPTALLPGLSLQRTIGGEETARLAVVLQIVTGNIGKRGGSPGLCIWNRLPPPVCPTIALTNERNSGPSIPLYRWAEAIAGGTEAGYPTDVKLIYNAGSNYLNQGSDIQANREAFRTVDFAVCHELFLTPTARYCDIILPVTSSLERDDVIFSGLNYLFYSHKVIGPISDVRNDYDIFSSLAERLGFRDRFTENRTAEEWLTFLLKESEISDIETFKRTGIYDGGDQERIGLSAFFSDPAENPLSTPSGKIEISSATYAKTGFPAIPKPRVFRPTETYPLRLITPHALFRINSTNWNIEELGKREKQELWIHPEDAASAQIVDGGMVVVQSEQGIMTVPVKVTQDIIPGVVSLLQGAWYTESQDDTDLSGSVNVLTSAIPTLPSESSRTHSVSVKVFPR